MRASRGARAGSPVSGIYDLEPIRLNYLNEKLCLDAAEADRNSQVRHLPATAGELVVAYAPGNCPNWAASRSNMAEARRAPRSQMGLGKFPEYLDALDRMPRTLDIAAKG